MGLLVLNAGSSNLKCALFARTDTAVTRIASRRIDTAAPDLEEVLAWAEGFGPLEAVAHRVVHGGDRFTSAALLDEAVLAALEALSPLAPLHQPKSLQEIGEVMRRRPGLPQVAAFDTAFHASLPPAARRLGLPRALHEAGVRRYGFHGLSYAWIAGRLRALDPELAAGRVIVAHLGSGSSLCAIRAGASVETTMGFSALDGLMMATRCGALDPGVVPHLIRRQGMSAEAVERLLYQGSGLLGVSGLSGDMRVLLESGEPAAREAVELYAHMAVKQFGAMAAALEGVDGVVFTGGVGENSERVRALICDRLGWLGVRLAASANRRGGEALISDPAGGVRVYAIPTDEEQVIADEACAILPK